MSDKSKDAGQAPATAAKSAEELAAEKTFVTMTKAGEEPLQVHPSTVESHIKAGWARA